MVKYIIIHNKHEGCYDFQYYEDAVTKMRLTSITINPPKIFMFEMNIIIFITYIIGLFLI